MKVFFRKDLAEIRQEKELLNYQAKIEQLQSENEELREELLLTQEAVNELLFTDTEVE